MPGLSAVSSFPNGGFHRPSSSSIYEDMSVAEIKAKAKEAVNKDARGASALTLIKTARTQMVLAKECESKSELKGALSAYIKAASFASFTVDSPEYIAEWEKGGVVHKEVELFIEEYASDINARAAAIEEMLKTTEKQSSTDNCRVSTISLKQPSLHGCMRALHDQEFDIDMCSKRMLGDSTILHSSPLSPKHISTSIPTSNMMFTSTRTPLSSTSSQDTITSSATPSPPSPSPSSSPLVENMKSHGFMQAFPSIDGLNEGPMFNLPQPLKEIANDKTEYLISKAFLDDAQNGRQLQQGHPYGVPVLDQYRKELDKALQILEQRQMLLDAAKQEISVLQGRTLALQMQLDDPNRITLHNRSAKSDPLSMERFQPNSSEDIDYLDTISPLSSSADKKALKMNSLAEHGSQASKAPQVRKPGLRFRFSTYTQRPEHPAPNQLKPIPLAEALPKPSAPILKPSTPISLPTKTAQHPSNITTIGQLQALMDAAHAGDVSALKQVKMFSRTAHQTPIANWTELQHYVVKHWHRKAPRSPYVPAQIKAVGGPAHTEIYVDASQWGIRFVMDGMWSAWKFSDSLALSSNSFDIGWAEMVAVEVGLWTVVHWFTIMVQNEGKQLPLKIGVQCDNAGVVKAVEKRHTRCKSQQDVLQRIFEVVRTFDVQLAIKWIASAQNLADNPSRGVACHGTTQLPLIPSLPSYLSDILNPISTNK